MFPSPASTIEINSFKPLLDTLKFTRKELSDSGVLQWSDLAEKTINDDKSVQKEEQSSDSGSGEDEDNNG